MYCPVLPLKSAISASTWSGVKAIQSTTTSKLCPVSASAMARGSFTSAMISFAPLGTNSRRWPRFSRYSSMPLSTTRGETAELMSPVPPMNNTFMEHLSSFSEDTTAHAGCLQRILPRRGGALQVFHHPLRLCDGHLHEDDDEDGHLRHKCLPGRAHAQDVHGRKPRGDMRGENAHQLQGVDALTRYLECQIVDQHGGNEEEIVQGKAHAEADDEEPDDHQKRERAEDPCSE